MDATPKTHQEATKPLVTRSWDSGWPSFPPPNYSWKTHSHHRLYHSISLGTTWWFTPVKICVTMTGLTFLILLSGVIHLRFKKVFPTKQHLCPRFWVTLRTYLLMAAASLILPGFLLAAAKKRQMAGRIGRRIPKDGWIRSLGRSVDVVRWKSSI